SHDEAFHGGGPVIKPAVEMDDAEPKLRAAARKAKNQTVGVFEQASAPGIRQGEFPEGEAGARAGVIVAALGGGCVLGSLYKDRAPIDAVLEHLERYVRNGFR